MDFNEIISSMGFGYVISKANKEIDCRKSNIGKLTQQ